MEFLHKVKVVTGSLKGVVHGVLALSTFFDFSLKLFNHSSQARLGTGEGSNLAFGILKKTSLVGTVSSKLGLGSGQISDGSGLLLELHLQGTVLFLKSLVSLALLVVLLAQVFELGSQIVDFKSELSSFFFGLGLDTAEVFNCFAHLSEGVSVLFLEGSQVLVSLEGSFLEVTLQFGE